ncbi:HGGxSTG domain-containing protein [Ancylobacter novellus]|uniref:HGGxSTG domain-containing protein n=1 Tax=Ancylobacter novellus TaxID=921 RepID=UPI0023428AB8|nr:HGGxSTG domain-containing protein [Ancylobacter novellus]
MRTTPDPSHLHLRPRCGAKTRSGSPCQSPAVHRTKRCRMHDGVAGAGAPREPSNGNYRHGRRTIDFLKLGVSWRWCGRPSAGSTVKVHQHSIWERHPPPSQSRL